MDLVISFTTIKAAEVITTVITHICIAVRIRSITATIFTLATACGQRQQHTNSDENQCELFHIHTPPFLDYLL